MAHFVMLWDQMLDSSINEHEAHVKWVFVTCLLMCDKQGHFTATPRAIAKRANVPQDQADDALAKLQAPDPYSTTPENDGRRLVGIGPNSWEITNYVKYRQQQILERNRALDAMRKARSRTGHTRTLPDTTGQTRTIPDNTGHDRTQQDTTGQNRTEPDPVVVGVYVSNDPTPNPTEEVQESVEGQEEGDQDDGFEAFWGVYPRKVKKKEAQKSWNRLSASARADAAEMLPFHVKQWQRELRPMDKIPHPATWLNNEQWTDELVELKGPSLPPGHRVGEAPDGHPWAQDDVRRFGNPEAPHPLWDDYMDECFPIQGPWPRFEKWLEERIGG